MPATEPRFGRAPGAQPQIGLRRVLPGPGPPGCSLNAAWVWLLRSEYRLRSAGPGGGSTYSARLVSPGSPSRPTGAVQVTVLRPGRCDIDRAEYAFGNNPSLRDFGLAGVVSNWVDVPLGRLEQDQRHIDPEPATW